MTYPGYGNIDDLQAQTTLETAARAVVPQGVGGNVKHAQTSSATAVASTRARLQQFLQTMVGVVLAVTVSSCNASDSVRPLNRSTTNPQSTSTGSSGPWSGSSVDPSSDGQWQVYASRTLGVSFKYPPNALIIPDTYNSLVIATDSGGIFWVSLEYNPSNPYENPPPGTNIEQWIFHNPQYPSTYTGTGAVRVIAGIRTLHAITRTTDRTGASSDAYLLLHGTKLLEIVVIHVSNENERVVNGILDSIRLDPRP